MTVRRIAAVLLAALALLLTGCGTGSAPSAAADAPADMPAVGDRITFGSWPQTGHSPQPVEWRVLAVEGDRALVISEKLLAARPYNERHESVTWESCSLRAWLNGEFCDTAFSDEERSRIAETVNSNPNNGSFFWVNGGHDTTDRVFCLSTKEAKKYFIDDSGRQACFTPYASPSAGAVSDDERSADWWLRSPGGLSNHAAAVSYDGHVIGLGVPVGSQTNGVRPAMWLRFE